MDFGRKILGKYGWKDGDGLGKNNNGIAKPLRATLKFDNSGFGADQAATDFNNHWWERVFNDAASNVEVKQEGEIIKMDLVDHEDGVEISTKGFSMKKLKKAKESRSSNKMEKSENIYNNFLQAATLTNTGNEIENPDRIDVDDIEVTKVKVLTDEELFKACGGRTAHKGARHGLKLSGKLARLEQQEEELLAKMLAKRKCSVSEQDKTKLSKQNKKKSMELKENEHEQQSYEEDSQKTKRKHLPEDNVGCFEINELQHSVKKHKKTKASKEIIEEAEYDNCENKETSVKKKKRKHKKTEVNEEDADAKIDAEEIIPHVQKTKKNKRQDVTINEADHQTSNNESKKKSKKKKQEY